MATIAQVPSQETLATTSWEIPSSPPEYAQGDEGRLVDYGAARAAVRWRGPSEYVATLLTGRNESSRTARMLPVAGLLAVGCAGLALGGIASDWGGVLFPLAAIAGLGFYTFLTRWVAKQRSRSGVLRFAERIRRAIAYEGDCQPR